MAPAQPFMDSDLDIKPHIAEKMARASSVTNLNGKGLRCRSICQDTNTAAQAMLDDQTKAPKCPENLDVDIIGCTVRSDIRLPKSEDPDATEYSSSFADTLSNTENCSGLSEGEVESQFFGDNSLAPPFDAFSVAIQVRKKKLTNHWRNFIRPLMWRCKWTELRIKELESRALKYCRESETCDQRKHLGFNQFMFEELGSKSLPFSHQCYKNKAVKRRKRKRVEDTTDITSYMSQHNLFSYLEIKKSDPDGSLGADDFGPPVITDQNGDCNDKFGNGSDWSFFELDGEHFLEQVLWKIEMVHSRVHKLKGQIDIILSKNAARFSSSENLSLLTPCDGQTSSAHSPTCSAGNGETVSVGHVYSPPKHMSVFDNVELVMPGSAILSYAEAVHVSDIIESTVGLLSAADVTLHEPQIGDSCEDIVDAVVVPGEAAAVVPGEVAAVERHTFKNTDNQSTETHQEPEIGDQEESNTPSMLPTSEPLCVEKSIGPQEQLTLTSCLASDVHFPRNKRKRGERKAGSGCWSKRSSSEPDSQ